MGKEEGSLWSVIISWQRAQEKRLMRNARAAACFIYDKFKFRPARSGIDMVQNPMELPPSTGSTTPVRYFALSDARNRAASPISAGSPSLPIGVLEKTFCFLSASPFRAFSDISVAMNPGAIQLTRMPCGDSSTAMALVIPSIADFEAV